ncbi:MAG: hypothetical protein QNL78_01215 [Actinomycetes bacterium]
MQSLTMRLLLGAFLLAIGISGNLVPVKAAVSSSPTFELDASSASSLATSGATSWRDLVSNGATTGTLVGNAAYNAADGGSLSVSGVSGFGGAAFPATAAGSATNPSGDMSLMMWVKFSSFNPEWNLLASHWFSNTSGGSAQDWHFASRISGASRYLNLWTTNKSNTFGSTALELNTWYQVGFTLTWAGSLQFYVNGAADGPVVTGATRNANTSAQLWVSDARTNCTGCAMNGNISRFRMWNSALSNATVLNDFNVERENFGYTPFVTSASFSLASYTPVYRTLNTITATVPLNSKVTFYENRKIIPRCKRVSALSTTAICRWKPSTHGQINVRVSYTTSGSATVNWAPVTSVFGSKRTTPR